MATQPKEPILKSHRRPNVDTTVVAVGNVRFGDGSYPVVAGPAVVESEEQIAATAALVAEGGGALLRAGTYRAGASPYGFRGLEEEGLWLLEKAGHEAGLPTITEVLEAGHLPLITDHVNMIEIGPDNMQNYVLLKDAGRTMLPVLLHRGPSATVDEWLMSAEYILNEGNDQVVLCERGSRTFDPRTNETLDISAVPVMQRLTHLPVIVEPGNGTGGLDLLKPLALAGRSVGADGLAVSVHPEPEEARVGNGNQLDPSAFLELMGVLGIPLLRDEIDRVDRQLVELVARRLRGSVEIAKIKATRGVAMRSPDREAELIEDAREDAASLGVDPEYVEELFTVVLEHSRRAQQAALKDENPQDD